MSQKLVTFLGFLYQRGTRKHSYWYKIFFGPMKMFSCPPSIKKTNEVTNFCDKSRHLFLWQTNRTRLLISVKPCNCVYVMIFVSMFFTSFLHFHFFRSFFEGENGLKKRQAKNQKNSLTFCKHSWFLNFTIRLHIFPSFQERYGHNNWT